MRGLYRSPSIPPMNNPWNRTEKSCGHGHNWWILNIKREYWERKPLIVTIFSITRYCILKWKGKETYYCISDHKCAVQEGQILLCGLFIREQRIFTGRSFWSPNGNKWWLHSWQRLPGGMDEGKTEMKIRSNGGRKTNELDCWTDIWRVLGLGQLNWNEMVNRKEEKVTRRRWWWTRRHVHGTRVLLQWRSFWLVVE